MPDPTTFKQLLKQIFTSQKLLRCILFAGLPALLFYSFSLMGFYSAGFKTSEILTDPAQQSGQSSFAGFLSNIGVWLWVSSATICFFIAFTSHSKTNNIRRELLLLVGALSLLLAVDDFFMLHDRYVNQNICYFVYACLAFSLLLRHYKTILVDGLDFLLAGSLLALSIFTDLLQNHLPLSYGQVQIFEEGFKFIGGACWLYFCCRVAAQFNNAPAPQSPLEA